MNIQDQARERVCQTLLARINMFDNKLANASDKDSTEDIRSYYLRQTALLHRLEQVLTSNMS